MTEQEWKEADQKFINNLIRKLSTSRNRAARSTAEFNLREIKSCPICGTEIVATPDGVQPKKNDEWIIALTESWERKAEDAGMGRWLTRLPWRNGAGSKSTQGRFRAMARMEYRMEGSV
jgi:hypothetical protein